jgi:nitrite reductase (NO-forming)
MSSSGYAGKRGDDGTGAALAGAAAMLMGLLVVVLATVAILMWSDARNARNDSGSASNATATSTMPGMDMSGAATGSGSLASYAGAAPANASDLAAAHTPYPAELPAVPAGPIADVSLALTDINIQVAPGVHYAAWAWAGGAPGPVIHVRQGQQVKITLTNRGAIPHSVDFHAARIAPNKAFTDVLPGKSVSYTFTANDAGVFMYHCGTKPVLMHIANGMYGAIVVEPKPGVLPKADKNYVLVASEWYLSSDGLAKPATFNMAKAHARQPDWMTFNGYAGQYVTHPLTADPGQLVRFWVVDAGPSLDTDFHIVGTILNTAYAFGDMNPADALHNVQTVTVPAGGGGVFDVKIDQPGLYPFVSHAFAAVDQGQVGLLKVGTVEGTMSH